MRNRENDCWKLVEIKRIYSTSSQTNPGLLNTFLPASFSPTTTTIDASESSTAEGPGGT